MSSAVVWAYLAGAATMAVIVVGILMLADMSAKPGTGGRPPWPMPGKPAGYQPLSAQDGEPLPPPRYPSQAYRPPQPSNLDGSPFQPACPHEDWTVGRRPERLWLRWPYCAACGKQAARWVD